MNNMFSFHRFGALLVHYLNSVKRNPARIIEIFFWPSLELVLFCLLTLSIQNNHDANITMALVILSGVVYWNFFARIVQETVAQFMEDVISRNVQNLLISPISITELVMSLLSSALMKMVLSLFLLSLIILYFIPSFFNTVGIYTLAWVCSIIFFGCTVSLLIVGLLLIYGERVGFVGWVLSAVVQLFSCVTYERSFLPPILKELSYAVPTSYIFESLRGYLATRQFDIHSLILLNILTGIYLVFSILFIHISFRYAKHIGSLTKI